MQRPAPGLTAIQVRAHIFTAARGDWGRRSRATKCMGTDTLGPVAGPVLVLDK